MLSRVDRIAPTLFTGLAATFVLLIVYKMIVGFDGIPYWDTYDGTLDFYTRFTAGDWHSLWEVHNEHRILLSKVLFLVDLNLLDGTTPFLWLVNLALAGLIALVLVAFLREVPGGRAFAWMPAFLVAVSFSELQKENFYWSFQSQFFLAFLLPLAALYFALLSLTRPERSAAHFAASTGLGILSIGSMANGILVLPVLTVYALLTRMPWQRVAILAGLSILGFTAYFLGLPDKADAPSVLQVLQEKPSRFVRYILTYLGGPFAETGKVISAFAGLALLILAVRAAWKHIPRRRASSAEIALIGFMGYILLTALVTAIGRVGFGVNQALSSRYATPNLMNWCVLLMLYLPWLAATPGRVVRSTRALLVLVLLLFIVQLSALKPSKTATDRMGAALALELGIPDQDQVIHVYPRVGDALQVVDELRDDPKAIFAMEPIRAAGDLIGTRTTAAISACAEPAFGTTPVPQTDWLRINGPVLPGQGERLLI
ncbi:MAG TPA: hypothetical protein VK146_16180, partial [Tabrizicola sp.]|nr:hypothetical protein [Tabrizicola sp.]